jgi:hypothetical protein
MKTKHQRFARGYTRPTATISPVRGCVCDERQRMSGGQMITDATDIAPIDESTAEQPKTRARGASALLPKVLI